MEQKRKSPEQRRLNFREIIRAARRILAPVFLYLLIAVFAETVFLAASELFATRYGQDPAYRIFLKNESLMLMLLISIPASVFLYRMFLRDERRYITDLRGRKKFPCIRCVVFAAVGSSVGLNILIQLSPLIELFPSILEVNEELTGGSAALSVLYVIFVAPAVEELLFRGLVFQRSREYMNFIPAAVLSALMFGVMHANMVQFIYAFLLGLILAFVYEYYGLLRAPVLFHVIANLAGNLASVFTDAEGSAARVAAYAAGVLFIFFALLACVRIRNKVHPPVRSCIASLYDRVTEKDKDSVITGEFENNNRKS